MGLPDSTLRKPLQITDARERDIYATYPAKGGQVLFPLEVFHDAADYHSPSKRKI